MLNKKMTIEILLNMGFRKSQNKDDNSIYVFNLNLKNLEKNPMKENNHNVDCIMYDIFTYELYFYSIMSDNIICIQNIETIGDFQTIFKFIINKMK